MMSPPKFHTTPSICNLIDHPLHSLATPFFNRTQQQPRSATRRRERSIDARLIISSSKCLPACLVRPDRELALSCPSAEVRPSISPA
jgi:hypothetical protein